MTATRPQVPDGPGARRIAALILREWNFRRCRGDKIIETWVLQDTLDLTAQPGIAVPARGRRGAPTVSIHQPHPTLAVTSQ